MLFVTKQKGEPAEVLLNTLFPIPSTIPDILYQTFPVKNPTAIVCFTIAVLLESA